LRWRQRSPPQQLHVEDQGGVRRDGAARAAGAVPPVRLDGRLHTLALGHAADDLVPRLDDLALPESKGERLAALVQQEKTLLLLDGRREGRKWGMKSGSRQTRLSVGCGFRKETIAGMRRNGRDAPIVRMQPGGKDRPFAVIQNPRWVVGAKHPPE